MAFRYWSDLTTLDFASVDPEKTVAVLPVAAIEQHGPHLPVSTDTTIANGMIEEVRRICPEDLDVLVLPTQPVGKSNEHIRSPGTLTLSAEAALKVWVDLGESVARAGVRKLVMINSHGGNASLLEVVARELRVRCNMLCVHGAWRRFGLPAGLYTQLESEVGIHAGDIETSLMLHFRPDLVRMDHAANFEPVTVAMARDYAILRPTGVNAFGWIAQDLHASGAAGDASLATAEKGRLTAEFQAQGFVRLLQDVTRFPLSGLA
jgi:creatinine amidohydrolase